MSESHRAYLRDLGTLIREQATEARRDKRAAQGGEDAAFQSGRTMAYYEVTSLMKQQAQAFDLPLSDLGFEGFDPDHDTL